MRIRPLYGLILLSSLGLSCSLIVNNTLDEPRADAAVTEGDSRVTDMKSDPVDGASPLDRTRVPEGIHPPPPPELCSAQPRIITEELPVPPSPESFALQVDSKGTAHIIYVARDFTLVHKWWDPDALDWRFRPNITDGILADRVALAITDQDQLHLFYREKNNAQAIGTVNKRPGVLDDKWSDKWSDPYTVPLPFPIVSLDAGVFTTGLAQNSSVAFVSAAGSGHAYIRVKSKSVAGNDSHDVCPSSDQAADHTRIALASDQPFFVASRFEVATSAFIFEAVTWLDNQECPTIMSNLVEPAAENFDTVMPRPAPVVIQNNTVAYFAFVREISPVGVDDLGTRLMYSSWQITGGHTLEQVPFEHSVGPLSPALAVSPGNRLYALFTRIDDVAVPGAGLHGARFDPSVIPPWQIAPLMQPVGEANRIAIDPQNRIHVIYETMPDMTANARIELHHLCYEGLPNQP